MLSTVTCVFPVAVSVGRGVGEAGGELGWEVVESKGPMEAGQQPALLLAQLQRSAAQCSARDPPRVPPLGPVPLLSTTPAPP